MNYQIKSNQYIPYKGKRLPSGMTACETYYYIVDENNKVINKHTLKTYRGKNMDMYSFKTEEGAKASLILLELINSKKVL